MCWGAPWWLSMVALLAELVGRLRSVGGDDARQEVARAVFATLPEECAQRMVNYQPKITSARWERIREFVEDTTAITAPHCAYTQERLLIVCSHYIDWAVNIAGFPLEAKVLFRPELISSYTSDHMTQSAGTRRNYRAVLLRISELLLPESQGFPMEPLTDRVTMRPYSEAELAHLRFWARGQNTPTRARNAAVLLTLCAGAGLWASEVCELRRGDITMDADGTLITVRGDNARQVPMLRRWEADLLDAVDALEPGDRVFGSRSRARKGKNLVNTFIATSVLSPHQPRPQTNRMRATWLVTHLAARTDMRALMTASGVGKFENLARLLQYVPALDTVEYRRMLRGEAGR